jgi:KDO2-lipid IV(A) lauroyltransferase
MSRILFYGVLKPLSYVPLKAMYWFSDFLFFFVYHVVKYRRSVVKTNLRNSFPEKTRSEITVLERECYSHICDLVVESIRLFSMTEEEALRRCKILNPEFMEDLYHKGKSVIVVGGHYNNWELTGAILPRLVKHHILGIYAPLSNDFFNKTFNKSRGRFGLEMVSKLRVKESFEKHLGTPTATLFGTDQSPTHSKNVYWTTFLNQETAVMLGSERFAKDYDYPVVYLYLSKVKRGYYECEFKMLEEHPRETVKGAITEKHTRWLEEQIKENPQYWLWTHKRWKRKRKSEM